MNVKRIAGLIALVAGIALLLFANHAKNRIANAKSNISTGTSLFSGNSVAKSVGGYLQGEASQYDTTVTLCFVGGVALVIVGAGLVIFGRKKHR